MNPNTDDNEIGRRVNNVHVNPNFNKPHINRNFPFATGGLHINPNFIESQVLNAISQEKIFNSSNSLSDYTTLNPVQPKIHFNPKHFVSQATPVICEENNKSKYVLHSKNKIIKAPSLTPPASCYSVENSAQSYIPPIVNSRMVPKKPSYSFVRKNTSKNESQIIGNPKPAIPRKQSGYDKHNLYNAQKKLSAYKVWKRKSSVVFIKNKYKLCNKIPIQRRRSLTTPSKYNLCNTSRASRLKTLAFAASSSTFVKTVPSVRRSLLTKPPEFVFIRGEKYIVNNNVLKKVVQKASTIPSTPLNSRNINKISVSGVTYVRKTNNTFVVDNRTQNSVKKRRKLNITCPTFRRLGICLKNVEGKCPLVHNPKNISICPKFLKGICKIDDCHLSHEVVPEKMPTCRFFLEGCCIRETCPYLHVKVNDSAKVCLPFLQGYCQAAVNCKSVHIYVCPDFYKYAKCERVKCPYPHKKTERKGPTMPSKSENYSSIHKRNDKKVELSNSVLEYKSVRYFQDDIPPSVDKHCTDEGKPPCEQVNFKDRPKLGTLPSFIALE